MKPSLKYFSIFFVIATIAAISAFYLRYSEVSNFQQLFKARQEETKRIFQKTFELKTESIATLAKDYTYWDDLVDFVKTADPDWAKDNLETSLDTYSADSIWVYGLDNRLIYSVTKDTKGQLSFGKEMPLTIGSRLSLFDNGKRFTHFFSSDPLVIVEIRGATIHPSDDQERKTLPKGYFFVGRYLTKDFVTDLAQTTETTIKIVKPNEITGSSDKTNIERGDLTFFQSLPDINSYPIAFLSVSKNFNTVKQFIASTNRDFYLLSVLASSILLALGLIVYLLSRTTARASRIAKEMTENLRENEEKFRLLAENSKEIIALLKADTTYVYVSPAIKSLTGYTAEELLGRSSYDFIHPDDVTKVRNHSHGIAVIQKSASNVEYRFKKKDGEYTWFETVTQPVLFRDGKVDRIQASSRDISDRKRNEEALARQNEELIRLNKVMVNRELKMIELKKEISELKKGKN